VGLRIQHQLTRLDFLRDEIRNAFGVRKMAPVEKNEQFFVSMFAEMSGNPLRGEFIRRCLRWRRGLKVGRKSQREKAHAPVLRSAKKGATVFSFARCSRETELGNQVLG